MTLTKSHEHNLVFWACFLLQSKNSRGTDQQLSKHTVKKTIFWSPVGKKHECLKKEIADEIENC